MGIWSMGRASDMPRQVKGKLLRWNWGTYFLPSGFLGMIEFPVWLKMKAPLPLQLLLVTPFPR